MVSQRKLFQNITNPSTTRKEQGMMIMIKKIISLGDRAREKKKAPMTKRGLLRREIDAAAALLYSPAVINSLLSACSVEIKIYVFGSCCGKHKAMCQSVDTRRDRFSLESSAQHSRNVP
jgi:hypothetical protein